ncbi:hypothetical protein [Streptomyces sp. NPDC001348]
MTWPAALLPGAAVRVLRTAAGRRALQLGLLVGGLFALGFLCGGPAQAAEGTAPVESTPSVTSVTSTSGAVGQVVRSVGAQVPRPVGDLVGTVAQDLDEARAKAPSLPALPGVPVPPKLPTRSSLPPLPSLPPPVVDPPAPQQPGGPGVSAPGTASGGHEGTKTRAESARAEVRTGHRATVTASFGPQATTGAGTPFTRVRVDGHVAADRAGAPTGSAPVGDPGGALANRAAVDSGTSRHADAHAVTPGHLAPLRLAPGATARVDASGTRDRYRDVPVFPG